MKRVATSILALGLALSGACNAVAQDKVIRGKDAEPICVAAKAAGLDPTLIIVVSSDGVDQPVLCVEGQVESVKVLTSGTLVVSNPKCTEYTTTTGFKIYIPPGCTL